MNDQKWNKITKEQDENPWIMWYNENWNEKTPRKGCYQTDFNYYVEKNWMQSCCAQYES
jgi:hypothetical protein